MSQHYILKIRHYQFKKIYRNVINLQKCVHYTQIMNSMLVSRFDDHVHSSYIMKYFFHEEILKPFLKSNMT
jgi:hypothetical protein